MKPLHMIVRKDMNISFQVEYNRNEDLFRDSRGYVPYHYHGEYELMYVIRGCGTRIVGSSIETFGSGDFVFMGPELPHVWNGELPSSGASRESEYIYLCFSKDIFGPGFFSLPELQDVKKLLDRSVQGIKFSGTALAEGAEILRQMVKEKKARRFILLLSLLDILSSSKEGKTLNSRSFAFSPEGQEGDRINKAMKYILDHYHQDISVEKIADHIGMSPNAFSRFFKSKTYKHFIEFVNEVRITNATRMLASDSQSIADVAYHCGYNSLSNFNRHFKRHTRITPMEYKQKLIKAM